MADVLVAELKRGDRVVLSCEKARFPGSRAAKFEGRMGETALFLLQSMQVASLHTAELHMILKVGADGTLSDDEGRVITVARDEHREIHG